ncbi:hypothetical protein Tco_0736994 [Tanacetum coccineum]
MPNSFHIINLRNCDISDLIVTIPHNLCNMIITKSDGTKKVFYKVDELSALLGHVLRASRVQVPNDDLYDLHWTREKDREFEIVDPQFLLGSKMLEDLDPKMLGSSLKLTDFATLVLLQDTLTFGVEVITAGVILFFLVLFLDYDPLALVEGITPIEDNKGLLVVWRDLESCFLELVEIALLLSS